MDAHCSLTVSAEGTATSGPAFFLFGLAARAGRTFHEFGQTMQRRRGDQKGGWLLPSARAATPCVQNAINFSTMSATVAGGPCQHAGVDVLSYISQTELLDQRSRKRARLVGRLPGAHRLAAATNCHLLKVPLEIREVIMG